jgi:hypothetical protein
MAERQRRRIKACIKKKAAMAAATFLRLRLQPASWRTGAKDDIMILTADTTNMVEGVKAAQEFFPKQSCKKGGYTARLQRHALRPRPPPTVDTSSI